MDQVRTEEVPVIDAPPIRRGPRPPRRPRGGSQPDELKRLEKWIQRLNASVRWLERRHAAVVMRTEVVTEVAWFARVFMPEVAERMCAAAVWAIDLPDQWWAKQYSKPLGVLAPELLRLYDERPPVGTLQLARLLRTLSEEVNNPRDSDVLPDGSDDFEEGDDGNA